MKPQLEILTQKPNATSKQSPLLFVHGMWHGAWCWEKYFLPYFAKNGYAAYAMSLRGHGKSEGRDKLRWTSLADYVTDVETVVEQIGTPPVLVGHSMGGMIVQKYLEKHQIPATVLLASGPPRGLLLATLRVAKQRPLDFIKVNLTLSLYPVIGTPENCQKFLFSDDIGKEQLMEHFGQMQDEAYRAYLDMILFNLPRPKLVNTQMLVLGAANDQAIALKEVHATAKAYGVDAEIFSGMAHDMMLETEWQKVADRIIDWLGKKGL
jgi:alpha-beta hydrolase superfamily lysophospholipase